MSRENVDLVRRAVNAHCSDDLEARIDALVAFWHPSCEYTSVMAEVEPHTYRGHDGIRSYLSDLAERWSEWRSEPEDVFDIGPDTVFAAFRFHAVGKDSGVPVQARLASVLTLSQGKLFQGRTYLSRTDALEAVGLSE